MKKNKYQQILKHELELSKVPNNKVNELKEETNRFIKSLNTILRDKKISAEIFLGGSLAKGTLIRKKVQDIDIFLRFSSQYDEKEIKKLSKKIFKKLKRKLRKIGRGKIIHGSRDYFNLKTKKGVIFEVVPTLKISNPEQARNVTDLSFFHVSYIKKKIAKNNKLADEIILAKAFCHAQKCYGAESYVRGFSGYGLELLICKCKTFINFLRQIVNYPGQIVIDLEKHYKNKQDILKNLNKAKKESPIIFIDPTFKERNILAGLSNETFERFKKAGKSFLRKPSHNFFKHKKIEEKELKMQAEKFGAQLKKIEITTNKQEGDIAGTKLLKFSKLLEREVAKVFTIKDKQFLYNGKQKADIYFIIKPKKQLIFQGPQITNKVHAETFRKKYVKIGVPVKTKSGKLYAIMKSPEFNLFFKSFKKRNKKHMKQMSIKRIKLVN